MRRVPYTAVRIDPAPVEVGSGGQGLEGAIGLGVEAEVGQDGDIRPGAIADYFEMGAQVAQYLAVDVDLSREGHTKTRPPAPRLARIVSEDIGLHPRNFPRPTFPPHRLPA